MRFHFNSSLFHYWDMPRPCSPLRSAAKPAQRSSLLGYAIAHRVFTWLSLCMANLRRSIPQQFCTIPEHLRSIHFPGYVLPCYSLADPILAGPSFAIANLVESCLCLCLSSFSNSGPRHSVALPCQSFQIFIERILLFFSSFLTCSQVNAPLPEFLHWPMPLRLP